VICVDPNSPKGLRWAITKAALEKTVGPGIAGAALLQHVESSGRPLPLFVHRVLNNQCFSHLLFLDQQSGEVAKRQTIPINVAYPKLPIISPDYRRIVADVSDISEWGKRDNFAMNLPLRLRVVDLESGKWRDTENLYEHLQLCWLHGFLNRNAAVLSDEHAVWILDTGINLRLRELFRLN